MNANKRFPALNDPRILKAYPNVHHLCCAHGFAMFFVDIETLGLDIMSPVIELYAIRFAGGSVSELHLFNTEVGNAMRDWPIGVDSGATRLHAKSGLLWTAPSTATLARGDSGRGDMSTEFSNQFDDWLAEMFEEAGDLLIPCGRNVRSFDIPVMNMRCSLLKRVCSHRSFDATAVTSLRRFLGDVERPETVHGARDDVFADLDELEKFLGLLSPHSAQLDLISPDALADDKPVCTPTDRDELVTRRDG